MCILLTPYAWLGGGYLVAITFSTLLIGTCTYVRAINGVGAATCVALLGIIASFPAMFLELAFTNALSGASFMVAIANAVACAALIPFQPRTLLFAALLCLAGLVPYAMVIEGRLERQQELAELAAKYPLKSLEARLEFDHAVPSSNNSSLLPLSREVDVSLVNFEQESQHFRANRKWALEMLHDETYRQFKFAEDFGAMRMPVVSEYVLQPPVRQHIRLPLRIGNREISAGLPPDYEKVYEKVHELSIADFFNAEGRGYFKSIREVAGFEPHGPTEFDANLQNLSPQHDEATLEITRLELVGLLRHDKPRVYIAEKIPLMNELDSLSHRALDEFEAKALPQLKTEKDTVIEEFVGGAKMLGAVRAGNDCLQCHNGPRGKMLGAFSYEFREIK